MAIDFATMQVNARKGIIDPRIFHDEEIYRLEMERIFGRVWLFVGHESMLKNSGDYITTFMGEDPIILTRDKQGAFRAFVNRCRHRGVQLCKFDRGNAKSFSCPYHGWTYGLDGQLIAVPELEAYGGTLDPSEWGLLEVPKVASYGGFIFANMDAGAMSLDDYLGDIRFYFDKMFGRLDSGGVEMSAIKQRVLSEHNWKIAADNASDVYHFNITHGGGIDTLQDFTSYLPEEDFNETTFLITTGDHGGPSHTAICAKSLGDPLGYDMHLAERLGQDSVDYVKRRYRMMAEKDDRLAPGYFSVAGLFPTMLIVDMGPITAGMAIEQLHPKGPGMSETWIYMFVEKDAPPALKKFSAQQMMRYHSVTGSVVPDDHENWEQMSRGLLGPASLATPLTYSQGLGNPPKRDMFGGRNFVGLPGEGQHGMTEQGGRNMYAYWAKLMQEA